MLTTHLLRRFMTQDLEAQRKQLVTSLHQMGVRDGRVLAAIAEVPREFFIDKSLQKLAYSDRALPIAMGQTISQPLMVAIMTQALRLSGQERVLEIGTGSGYQTAILSKLASQVHSIERYPALAYQAALSLLHFQVNNVSIYIGDGSLGWPEAAPYDRILVTAAAPRVPERLLGQLLTGGVLVIPLGTHERQDLCVIQRTSQGISMHSLGGCVFVPLIGEEGWNA